MMSRGWFDSPLGEVVLWVGGQARVEHLGHRRVGLQELRDRLHVKMGHNAGSGTEAVSDIVKAQAGEEPL